MCQGTTLKHFSFRYRVWVPHPSRVFVFAARVGFLYTIRRNALVVPQMAHSDFPALAAVEWQTTENKDTQGLKPNIFLIISRHD